MRLIKSVLLAFYLPLASADACVSGAPFEALESIDLVRAVLALENHYENPVSIQWVTDRRGFLQQRVLPRPEGAVTLDALLRQLEWDRSWGGGGKLGVCFCVLVGPALAQHGVYLDTEMEWVWWVKEKPSESNTRYCSIESA